MRVVTSARTAEALRLGRDRRRVLKKLAKINNIKTTYRLYSKLTSPWEKGQL
jgi:hypothetical protein